MEIKKMKCPDCGADIEYEPGSLQAKCEYCGGVFHVEGAVREQPQPSTINVYNNNVYSLPPQTQQVKVKKNGHLWLWVLGWLCCFPIPLTILIWRSNMNKKVKIGLTAGLWLFILIYGKFSGSSRTNTRNYDVAVNEPARREVTTESTTRATTERTTRATTERTTRATTEATTEASTEETTEAVVDQTVIRPEFKEALDSYEAFMDEYISMMNNMAQNPDDLSFMTDYFDYMTKYEEFCEKIDKMDDEPMTDAESAYYVEVTTRVSAKLMKAGMSQ